MIYAENMCDTIRYLSNSPQRVDILNMLTEERMDVRDITKQLESPRSTVQRNVSILEEKDWLRSIGSEYTATTTGMFLCEEFVSMIRTVDTIDRIAPFLEAVDDPDEIDVEQLNDMDITTPQPGHPHLPTDKLFETLTECGQVQGLLPTVSSLSVRLFQNMEGDAPSKSEYILSPRGVNTLYRHLATEENENPVLEFPTNLKFWYYKSELPYGLFLTEDTVVFVAYDDLGKMQATLQSSYKQTYSWGRGIYEKYEKTSQRLEKSQVVKKVNETTNVDE
ncbi:winged helix-turn-helix domain-containing protein [Halococcus sp. IIIV-5B]|uniref:helix-turn-helix transcriptional regulator n=1 Tax=Halococcus sp. IIIV-5B TaxID=2321230 RepID=UPI000E713ECF|nr:winged helix-turn-helix domain-containing protein [Halococcus sp. IIIV-5B]RJT07537.1 ArsR family transcriptional regulator [Halococcus sp. IIIV-5B]